MTSEESILLGIKALFALLALGAMGWFVVRPILRMLRRTEDAELIMKPFEPPPVEEIEIPVGGFNTGKKLNRKELIEELRADPQRTALLMREMLREKDRPRGGSTPAKKR